MVAVSYCKHGVYVGGCNPGPMSPETAAIVAANAAVPLKRGGAATRKWFAIYRATLAAHDTRLRVPIVPPSAVGARINRITQRPEGARHAQEHL